VRYEILKSFKKGNSILAVHINPIKGKDGKTKTKGPNPLSYVGVTFSDSGLTATLHESVNGQWREYAEVDGSASYQTGGVPQQYRGGRLQPGSLVSSLRLGNRQWVQELLWMGRLK